MSTWFDRRVKVTALPRLAIHGLRRSQVAALLGVGGPPRVVAARTGHSVAAMMAVHPHVLPADDQVAARLVGGD
ncbi:MAG TPA: hypothetical protein VE152_08005 [Acidimicrobiales bacterium]|jgi:integrase|nr:hypothetical protein [Acidimicrobiales bacterium]